MDDTDPWEMADILELDHVFEALAHPRRRYVLYTLFDEKERSLWKIASKIAAWENNRSEAILPEEEVENVYISLYHNHVPKLVEDDIVRFSETTETIKPASNAEQVLNVLENAGGTTDSKLETHARGEHNEGQS